MHYDRMTAADRDSVFELEKHRVNMEVLTFCRLPMKSSLRFAESIVPLHHSDNLSAAVVPARVQKSTPGDLHQVLSIRVFRLL